MTSSNRNARQAPRSRRASRKLALIAVAFAATACSLGNPVSFDSARTGRRILFIGNSLTYFYNMPLIVEAMGDSTGGPALAVDMVAAADFSLQDHLTNGTAFGAIDAGGWEIVILQQGPSAQDDSRAELRQSALTFADRIRQNGGQPGLYMVWPAANAQADFPRVIESYTLAAADISAALFPVGVAWQAAMRRDSTHRGSESWSPCAHCACRAQSLGHRSLG